MKPYVLIESHEEDGQHWGVSFHGPNPLPHQYQECKDRAEAQRLLTVCLDAWCPRCGSSNILPPSRNHPQILTCDPCGYDFSVSAAWARIVERRRGLEAGQ